MSKGAVALTFCIQLGITVAHCRSANETALRIPDLPVGWNSESAVSFFTSVRGQMRYQLTTHVFKVKVK